MRFYVRPRWILFVALLPLVILGAIALAARAYGLVRHDPAYFTQEYLERYSTPGEVARALEAALQNGDEELLAELQGLRWPVSYEANPSLIFVMLWEHTDRYFTYLYFDSQTYERQPHYVEEVDGRWVMSPPDLYYYMNSGLWKGAFLPIAMVWWLVGGVTIALVWVAHVSERFRAQLYGE